ncbi:hypothetical protein JGU66_01050 [Myxococcaceae bacterium JPH2]|nr:hypothetical protein [Myxococcaceae bacterium JPH2]
MNSRLLAALLCLVAVTSGCVIHDNGCDTCEVQGSPGDVRFMWTFGGKRCSDDPSIKGVNISIPGEDLANGGYYPCNANGFDGIILHDFVPGTYAFDIEAVNYSDQRVYVGSGRFTVNGNVSVNIDLTPLGQPTSYAYVNWLFPTQAGSSYPSCGQAGIAYVDARVDDSNWKRFNCSEGSGGNSVQSPYLDPGQHYLEVVALDSQIRPVYYYGGGFVSQNGTPVSVTAETWEIGGASVRWDLYDGNTRLTCSQAGVSQVSINFQDKFTGKWVYGLTGEFYGCGQAPVVFEFLRPGSYYVSIIATGSNGRVYRSPANLPAIDVIAHQFPGPNSALTVPVARTN